MENENFDDAWTLGSLARHFGVESHRLRYAIESRGIEPPTRIGRYRVFFEPQLKQIEQALAEIGATPQGRPARNDHGDDKVDAGK